MPPCEGYKNIKLKKKIKMKIITSILYYLKLAQFYFVAAMIGPKIIAKIFEFIANHIVAIATFCVTLVITIVSQAVLYHGLTNGNLTIDAICMSFIFIRCRDVDFDGKSYRQFEIKVPYVLYTVLKIILTPIYWIFVLWLRPPNICSIKNY